MAGGSGVHFNTGPMSIWGKTRFRSQPISHRISDSIGTRIQAQKSPLALEPLRFISSDGGRCLELSHYFEAQRKPLIDSLRRKFSAMPNKKPLNVRNADKTVNLHELLCVYA
jgi:hypothetical protein